MNKNDIKGIAVYYLLTLLFWDTGLSIQDTEQAPQSESGKKGYSDLRKVYHSDWA
jgi:hypothetical protein